MFWQKRKQSDFRAEIEAHLELEAEQLKEQGLSEEEARMAARRAFGNVTRAQERFYESGRWPWWDHLVQDLRFGLRMLRKESRLHRRCRPYARAGHRGEHRDFHRHRRRALKTLALS